MRCELRIPNLNGHGKYRVHRNAHRQRIHVAVVNRAALRSDFDDALLLTCCARKVFAVPEKLQVAEPAEDCDDAKEDYAGNQEEPLARREIMRVVHRSAASLHDVRAV